MAREPTFAIIITLSLTGCTASGALEVDSRSTDTAKSTVDQPTARLSELRTATATDKHAGRITFLDLDGLLMEWSYASPESGYLYFYRPRSNQPVWSFAHAAVSDLAALTVPDLDAEFLGVASARGPTEFGAAWGSRAIRVAPGDILLARHSEQPERPYVLRIDGQEGPRLRVSYVVVIR